MDEERVTVELAIGGVSKETAKALSLLINAALLWRTALEDGGEIKATDALIDAIDQFVENLFDEKGGEETCQ